ncbi:FkbM family methyltransferase [Pseudodesulfovibrio sp.]|uniref:FkbM family methyltransferase n=1 Tax=unclassified Pseudodesulfovibrio TaxID=2661612 RepID=UPI003AFFB533
MHIRDLLKEVEASVETHCSSLAGKSRKSGLWAWADRTHGSLIKRLASVLDSRAYKSVQRLEAFPWGKLSQEFWPIINDPEPYEVAYDKLADDESREVFLWRLKMRLSLPLVPRWQSIFPPPPAPGVGDLTIGPEEEKFCKPFKLGQYVLRDICMPEPGDTILDLGAFLGDTAVMFSRLVGETGHVYSFEALSGLFPILQQNLNRFGCANVTPCFNAAWNKTETLYMEADSSSSRVGDSGDPVPGIRIDDFMAEHDLERVDMIKMDIEGAEQEALEGATETVCRYHPKLALCVYHKPEDIHRLLTMAEEMYAGYRFYLRHYEPGGIGETVLYAVP